MSGFVCWECVECGENFRHHVDSFRGAEADAAVRELQREKTEHLPCEFATSQNHTHEGDEK